MNPTRRTILARTLIALAVFAVIAGSGVAASAAVFNVVGFGDSIMNGQEFDDGSGSPCNPSNADTCGFIGRLPRSPYYNCSAADCRFVNRGVPGEFTFEGITRLNQILNQSAWDLVVLLEGTNDINEQVSVETVQFNLNQMAIKAKARNAATAHASIIRFNPTFEKPGVASRNNSARKLRDAIASQASSAGRCFVDAWSQLCPTGPELGTCLDKNYWKGGIDGVGHPSTKGYNVLAEEFYRVLGGSGPPGAAEIVAPEGKACGKSPVVEWNKETVSGSSCGNWYRVQLDGAGGTKFDDWFQQGDVCSGSSCSVTIPGSLGGGNYSVRVRTRNTRDLGPWSAGSEFSVVLGAPKKIAKTFGPSGEFFVNGGLAAELEWKPVSNAAGYRVEIATGRGAIVLDEAVTGVEECSGNRCIYAVAEPLPTGTYSWRVQAQNVCGGTFTDPTAFEVVDGPPALAPLTVSPSERLFDRTPTFKWNTVEGAFEFEIEYGAGTSARIPVEGNCTAGTCRFTPPALAPGSYNWRVRGINPLGEGAWSESTAFQIADCDCFEGRAAGGSSFLLAKPANWNGELVIWSHESNYLGFREFGDFPPLAQQQFDDGYALGTTSYTVTGWPLFKSKRDLEKVYTSFVSQHGEPSNVYLVGESVGALVALAAVETASLGNVAGALAMCGPLAGAPNWEGTLDQRLAYDAVCSEVPGATIPGGAKGLPKPHDFTADDIATAVNICTGLDKKRGDRTVEEKQRTRKLMDINGTEDSGLIEAMGHATFGLSDLVRDKKKLKGSLPVGNVGVDYELPSINSGIQRAQADPKARAKLERFYQLTGDVGETKVISLHTSKDPVFFVENQREYADIAPAENLVLGIVRQAEAVHCGFSETEELAAWRALTIWAEGGAKPKPKNLQSRCTGIRKSLGGTCSFDKRPKIDPLAERIRPRS